MATDADGRAVASVLEAERYRVWASAAGHETADTNVERNGQRTDVVIDLAKR
ncbi:MAG: hypothetical protein L6Q95_13525 [Planctomycetes bacterium]|nr:hypothetical protein [Planctomycetota bacterium]